MTIGQIIAKMRALDPTEPSFYGEQDEAHITTLERLLGVSIPPSLQTFLIKHGGGDGYTGLFNNSPESLELGCIFGDNLRAREKQNLPNNYLLIEISPFRELFCIDTASPDETGECPVVRFGITPEDRLTSAVVVAPSFAEYLHTDLQSRLEVLQEEMGEDQAG